MRQADYRSPEFYDILKTVNSALVANGLRGVSADDGIVMESRYNVGKYGNTYMWRVTSHECPQLLTDGFIDKLIGFLTYVYPTYVSDKTITCANPRYAKSQSTGEPLASVVVMLTELRDNVITKRDLDDFAAGDENAVAKCLEIESRMFRRDDDLRDPLTRIEDFAFSLVYEPKLETAELKRITSLKLKHQTEAVTLETDSKTDFVGEVDGVLRNIEGKSTKAAVEYVDTEAGHMAFADYFRKRLESGSLGSIHNADYVLLVLKQTGLVVCVDVDNPEDNWLAGEITL